MKIEPSRVVEKKLGDRIASLRIAANMTQETLSWEAMVSEATVSRAESGNTSLNVCNLRFFARALGVTMSELLKGID